MQYLNKFKEAKDSFTLTGNKLLIERLDVGEVKTAGGLFITESSNTRIDLKLQKPHVGMVIAVGQGYFDASENKYIPLETEIGNIVLINSAGCQYYATLPGISNYSNNQIGLTSESDVQFRFSSLEAFQQYARSLGGQEINFK
jgi:co-chaperonin GroES (HSP10)